MKNNTKPVTAFEPLSLGEKIRDFRKRRGWNQVELAGALGVSQSQVSSWERNEDRPSPSSFATIARHADESERIVWLSEAGLATYVLDGDESDDRKIPVLRDPTAAGTPRAVDESSIEKTMRLPRAWLPKDGKLYGLHVQGDSMSPIVNDGDLVIVNISDRDPYKLIGHMVVAREGDGVTVKWLRRDAGIFFLVPQHTSERHPILVLRNDGDGSIIGEVVKIIGDPPAPKRK